MEEPKLKTVGFCNQVSVSTTDDGMVVIEQIDAKDQEISQIWLHPCQVHHVVEWLQAAIANGHQTDEKNMEKVREVSVNAASGVATPADGRGAGRV